METGNAEFRTPKALAFSLVEMLIALAISATLLVAVTMAINTSFYAYASAAESASTQSSARLVVQRLTLLIRTTSLHDAYDPLDPAVTLGSPAQPPVQTVGIQMVDLDGNTLRLWWALNDDYEDEDLGDLWYSENTATPEPMLEQVRIQRTAGGEPYLFTLTSRNSDGGLLLSRATIDLTVEPGADATLAIEDARGSATAVRIIASATPRRNLE